ncbi:RNA polymerase sigma factor [Symbioplanes lichenis]|uniref:RNA polymerase sigma factor n=1 Tax=Symbioplanes lichenis TaxID=1629072 RepID=UPI0027387B16|nr:RNA polymerase sigma factor [Actinoplanes lichenis]
MRGKRRAPVPPVTEQSSDGDLLRAIAAAQRDALQLLHRRHAGWLRFRLSGRCADHDVVDAALQDTFVAIWRNAHTYRETSAEPAAWIWTIAVRRLVSALRGPGHRWLGGPVPLSDVPEEQLALVPSAEDLVLLHVEHGELGTALDRLPSELRAVIQVTAVDGLTVKEAARYLGLPEGTAKTRLMRARARLRELLT